MHHDLTKEQKRALHDAAELAHNNDREMAREDRDIHYLAARNAELPLVVGGAVARGVIRIGDVGEAARELISSIAGRIGAVLDGLADSAIAADDPFDPSAVVSISAIVSEIDSLHEEATLYLHRHTGEVLIMENEYLPDRDLEVDDEAGVPDSILEIYAAARAIASDPDWLPLLRHHEINNFDIMRRFARDARPAASRDLEDALSGRGAYRRFRDVIRHRGLEQEWKAYRLKRLARDVRFRVEAVGIPFRK